MFDAALKKYVTLNKLSHKGGVVLMGGSEDMQIPLCELKDSFKIEDSIYNRSFESLSVLNAEKLYEECIAPLDPDTAILHIGDADTELFRNSQSEFLGKYVG